MSEQDTRKLGFTDSAATEDQFEITDYIGGLATFIEKCDTPMTFEEAKARLGIVDSKPIKMTNEEYMRSCNTEQLAEWLVEVTQYCFECGLNTNNCVLCPFGKCIDKGFAMEWLKQPHTIKE